VDPTELVEAAVDQPVHSGKARKARVLATDELSSVFPRPASPPGQVSSELEAVLARIRRAVVAVR
jgi:hypothetical protein